jgi:DNA-binding NtrC family response regulator
MTQPAKQNGATVLPVTQPYAVVSVHFDKSKDPAGLQRALEATHIRLAAGNSVEEARQLIDRLRPIAGLLYFGATIDTAAMRGAAALMEYAPRLRLIALVEPALTRSSELATLVAKGLIHDFHSLPVCRDRLMFSIGHIAGLVALENSDLRAADVLAATDQGEAHIVGASSSLARVFQQIRKFAEVDAPVLVTGETGTGKELAARAIHDRSPFRKGPFVSINCAGLPTSIIESELFGYERGAFTGAIKQKIGRIEAARGGTLFLDEIGDLPIEVQGHLLRFLQEKTIERLGGTKSITVDTRVIAATNVSLEEAIKEGGRFREDLYYRLNVLTIDMPPLRERGDDVQLLATYFLRKFSSELKLPKLGFQDSALEKMQRYRWPGNVRELISTIRRAVVMGEGRWLMAQDITFSESAKADRVALPDLATARQELEEKLIRDALRINSGNIKRAARELGVSRVTFYRLMEKFGIQPEAAAVPRHPLPRIVPARPPVPRPPVRKGKASGGLARRAARHDPDDADQTGEAAT